MLEAGELQSSSQAQVCGGPFLQLAPGHPFIWVVPPCLCVKHISWALPVH